MSDYAHLLESLPEFERQLAEAELRVRALREIVDGIHALHGDQSVLLSDPETRPHGRTREGFLRVMEEAPGRMWKLTDIRRRLLTLGMAPSSKAVDATAKRLRESGIVTQPRYGYYMLAKGADA